MKKKNKIALFCLTMISSFSAIGLLAYGTYCAFLNKEEQSFEYENQISPLSSYFDGGQGTVTDPFVISDEQSFVDLQKLVQLGCFDYNTFFILGADITFNTNTVLSPIGTHNCPFRSQFDGRGHKLNNVHVSSVNHEDIGLFGYVANGANIKNFIMNAPHIVSTGPTTLVTNPLQDLIKPEAIATPTCTDTNVTFTTTTVQSTKGKSYNVFYRSSVPEFLSDSGSIQTTATDMPKAEFCVHMDAIITDTIQITETVPDGNGSTKTVNKNMVISYVVERFKIYIDGNKKILAKDKNGATKIFPLLKREGSGDNINTNDPHFYQEKTKDSNGNLVPSLTLDHVNYVGFIVGHLDGNIEYVGVYNGILEINIRRVVSFSSLIGRDKDDDTIDSTNNKYYYQEINFSDIIKTSPTLSANTSDTYYQRTPFNENWNPNPNAWSQSLKGQLDKIGIDTDYNKNFNRDQPGLENVGIQMPNAFRLYNSFGVTKVGGVNATILDNKTFDKSEVIPAEGIYFTENLSHNVLHKNVTFSGLGTSHFHAPHIYDVNNCIWIFSNQEFLDPDNIWDGVLNILFGEQKEIFININIQYSVDNAVEAAETDLVVYTASQSDIPTPNSYTQWLADNKTFPQLLYYNDLDLHGDTKIEKGGIGQDETVPAGNIKYYHFKPATLYGEPTGEVDAYNNPTYYPYDPKIVPSINKPDGSAIDLSNVVLEKSITSSGRSTTQQGWDPGKTKVTYNPLFIIGLNNKNSNLHPKVNIFQVELILSYDKGNFSFSLNNVDYLYDLNATYDAQKGTWTNWAREESGVKIYIIVDDRKAGIDQGLKATYTRSTGWGHTVSVNCNVLANVDFAPGNSPASQKAYIYDQNGNRLRR